MNQQELKDFMRRLIASWAYMSKTDQTNIQMALLHVERKALAAQIKLLKVPA